MLAAARGPRLAIVVGAFFVPLARPRPPFLHGFDVAPRHAYRQDLSAGDGRVDMAL